MAHTELIRVRPQGMTRRERFMDSLRSWTLGPWSTKDKALARALGGRESSAGVAVNEHTAMNYSAVWSAVNLIASDIASVPLKLYKRSALGKEAFEKHAIYRLVHDQPNPEMGSFVFRRTLQAHKMVWGNGYAEIERDVSNRPVALWPLMPYAVQPFYAGGRLRYRVYNPTEQPIDFDAADILHIRGLGDDGTCGLSVIAKARESLGLGIAAERFGATFFGNGSTFDSVITYPPGIATNPQVRKENQTAIDNRHKGVDKAHRMLALYEGAKIEQMGVPPNDAQFLETREFQIEEVCRWFNVQPHKLKHLKRSTNNNIEQQSIEYVTDTLDPHWVDWEQELNMKLVAPLERAIQFFEHVREGRLRGDSAARGELQSKQFSTAMLTVNEGRDQENRNHIDGGDTAFVALNLIPIDLVYEWYRAEIEVKKMQAKPPAPPPPPVDPNAAAEKKALEDALTEARKQAQANEDERDGARAALATERHAHDQALSELDVLKADHAVTGRLFRDAEARESTLTIERDVLVSDLNLEKVRSADETARAVKAESERDVLSTTLDTERVKFADAIRALEGLKTAAETDRDAALALATEMEQARDTAVLKSTAAETTATGLAAERDAAEDKASTMTAQAELLSAERNQLLVDVDTLKADMTRAHEEAEARCADLTVKAEAAAGAATEARDRAELLTATVATVTLERDAALTLATENAAARDLAVAEAATRQADLQVIADQAVLELGAERALRTAAEETVAESQMKVAAGAAEADTLRSDLARARADIAAELERAQTQKDSMLTAQRHVFADAMGRMVRREVAKAKNYQANPRKLSTWVESFYDKAEEDIFVEAMLPAARLHLAWLGSEDDPMEFARGIALEHFAESKRTLTAIVDAGSEGFGEVLQRTLGNWEANRADRLADRVMEQEIRHGR